jgi:hypothetical protein
MLNFYTWSNNNYEIVLEGNSFYFAQKMCVAFRKKNLPSIFVRGQRNEIAGACKEFMGDLSHCGDLQYVNTKEFDYELNATYHRALIRGVRIAGLDRLFQKEQKKRQVRAGSKKIIKSKKRRSKNVSD